MSDAISDAIVVSSRQNIMLEDVKLAVLAYKGGIHIFQGQDNVLLSLTWDELHSAEEKVKSG